MGLLDGRACIVSGVGPGLGREIALACARAGADVVVAARTEAFLEKVAQEVEGAGRRCLPVATDISDASQCRRLVAAAVEEMGQVHGLVNSAFKPDVFKRFEEVDLDEWRAIVEVNLFGSLQLTKELVGHMKQRRCGSVVFVNSMIVRKYLPLQGGYAVSKGALMTAAQVLARELAEHGIRVNSVVPGWMWGPPVQAYVEFTASRRGVRSEQVVEEIASQIPIGEIPSDDDTAQAVVFLLSDMARAITGQALDVNGGEVFH